MNFNPITALYYSACISRPRMVGTDEEKKVANEIKELLEHFGYQVEEQPFQFSAALNTVISILLTLNIVLIGTSLMFTNAAIVCASVMLLLFISFEKTLKIVEELSFADRICENKGVKLWAQKLVARLGKRYTAKNLIAKIAKPHKAPNISKPHIYLVAHYDSKSQIIPIVVRIVLFSFIIGGGVTFAIINLLSSVFHFSFFTSFIPTLGILLIIASLPLIVLDVGNRSPGAIDNASGVGTVLHLAECIQLRQEWRDKLEITLLFPSAEEMGLMGAAAYVKNILAETQRSGRDFVLNFDGVGVDGNLCYVNTKNIHKPSQLLNTIKESCRQMGIPLGRLSMVGALVDHIPFANAGFDAISLMSVSRSSWWVHTENDSVEQLHLRGFEQAGNTAMSVIEKLAADL